MELGQFCRLNKNIIVNVTKYPQISPITKVYTEIKKDTNVVIVRNVSTNVVLVTDNAYQYEVLIKDLDEIEIVSGKLVKINKLKKNCKSIW